MATEQTILNVLDMLHANWPRETATRERALLYCRLLADIPDDVLQAACLQVIASARFFPAIAELREAALAMTPEVDGLPTAGEAWGEVLREIKRTGTDQWQGPPRFSHPLVDTAMRAMGWRNICLSEDGMADRAHFMRIYDALRQRESARARTLPEVRALTDKLRVAALPARAETETTK